MDITIKTLTGGEAGSVTLNETIYGLEPREDILQRMVRIALRRRTLTGGPNRRALALWREAERISAALNREPPEELLALAQKAKFSQHELTKEELQQFTDWLRNARTELQGHSIFHRLWYQYVLALW